MANTDEGYTTAATEQGQAISMDNSSARPSSSTLASSISSIISIHDRSPTLPQTTQSQQGLGADVSEDANETTQLESSGNDECKVSKSLWRPFFLRRRFHLATAILCILMIAALEVMDLYSRQHDGLATVSESHYYLWKYGPTSVLTAMAAVWGQVEYRTKQLMPWVEMINGPAKAENSLLLNYITPWTMTSLVASLKRGHFSVSVGILGTMLLQLLTISSTALLSVEYRSIQRQVDTMILDKFDFQGQIDKTDTLVASNYWAMIHYQVPLPHGTTADFATQSFRILPITNETVSANVDVFSAELQQCEPLRWKYADPTPTLNVTGNRTTLHNMNISSEACQLRHYAFPITGDGWAASVRKVGCSNNSSTEPDERLLISLSSSYYEPGQLITTTSPVYLKELRGIICKPTFSLARRMVSNDTAKAGAEDQLSISPAIKEPLTLGVDSVKIIDNVVSSVENDETLQAINSPFASNISTWLSLVNETIPQPDITAWTNETLLSLASQKVFRSFLPQWAKNGKISPDNRTVAGNATQVLPRLCVQTLSLRLMESFLILLCLGSFALCFSLGRISLPESPASLMALALLLSRSPALARVLEGSGGMEEKILAHKLSRLRFWCPSTNQQITNFSIHTESPDGSQSEISNNGPESHTDAVHEHPGASDKLKLWQPISGHLAYRTLVITVPILLAICLETIYQISSAHDGIADISLDGYTKYTWVFIPSITMVIVGLLFSTLENTARLLFVYQEMRKRGVDVFTMQFDPFANITLMGFCITLRKRNWPLAAVMFTSLLAPLLTIVTSSLYTPVEAPLIQNTTLVIQDWFDIRNTGKTWWDSTNRGMGLHMGISDLVLFANTSYPQWTYSEAVFPHLTFADNNLPPSPKEQRQELHARIPGVRANMNCTLSHMHHNGHFKTTRKDPLLGNKTELIIPVAMPPRCHPSGLLTPSDGDDDPATLDFIFDPPTGITSFFFADQVHDFIDPLYGMTLTTSPGKADANSSCSDNRLHLWFAVGHQTGNTTDDLALLHCAPYIEALAYTATFATRNFDINTTAAPVPDESTARPLLLDHNNMTTAPLSFAVTTPLVGAESALRAKNVAVPPGISAFFAALIYGAEGTPIADLTGADNVPRLIDRMQHLYRQLVAQVLHVHYRAELPPVVVASSQEAAAGGKNGFALPDVGAHEVHASMTDPRGRRRLVQSGVATRLLEVLLLCMAVAAAVGCWMGGSARVLPADPGSLAVRLAALVGSEGLVGRMQDGRMGWQGDEVWRTFQGERFALGWWNVGGDGRGRRRFGIDVGVPITP